MQPDWRGELDFVIFQRATVLPAGEAQNSNTTLRLHNSGPTAHGGRPTCVHMCPRARLDLAPGLREFESPTSVGVSPLVNPPAYSKSPGVTVSSKTSV